MRTSVYRYFASDGALLYVGVSHNPFGREVQHRRVKDMTLVASISLEWFGRRSSALSAEMSAIKSEKPLWNIAGAKPRNAGARKQRRRSKTQSVAMEPIVPDRDYMEIHRRGMAEFEALPIEVQEQAVAQMRSLTAG